MKMNWLKFSSFKNNGSIRQLTDWLAVIPKNDLVWSVFDFNGIGIPPNNMSMDDFEQLTRSMHCGFIMEWEELKKFANSITQTFDCSIVGARSKDDISKVILEKENFDSCEVVLRALDSTEWLIGARDHTVIEKWGALS